ncbi:MAG: hypothetical protein NTY48_04795 [Candidatus Diapherotrites archaeon]|nr:hypothetical protein [Candidatus Diapherotrites archaeon]
MVKKEFLFESVSANKESKYVFSPLILPTVLGSFLVRLISLVRLFFSEKHLLVLFSFSVFLFAFSFLFNWLFFFVFILSFGFLGYNFSRVLEFERVKADFKENGLF